MLKKLMEERAELQAQLEEVLGKAKTEERAMDEAEITKFDDLEKKIKAIDTTINAEERARAMEITKKIENPQANESTEVVEERAF